MSCNVILAVCNFTCKDQNFMDSIISNYSLPKIISGNAISAAIVVSGMLIIFMTAGVGQDPLQYVHSLANYKGVLLNKPTVLRIAIGLDNAFILFYVTMFLALALILSRQKRATLILWAALAFILLLGWLDLLENMHFLQMISSAEKGIVVPESEIKMQVWESLVKFHIGYIGLYLWGLALPAFDRKSKTLRFLLCYFQWVVGMAIYLVPATVAFPLVLTRFAFFLTALILIANIQWNTAVAKQ